MAVNTIIWSNNDNDRAPVWCDICKSPIIANILYETESSMKHHMCKCSPTPESRHARLLSHEGFIKLQDCKVQWLEDNREVAYPIAMSESKFV